MIQRRTPGGRIRLAFPIVAVATLAAAIGQVTLGGVVRVTDSGLGCPDWPLCHGSIVPPFELATIIEYSHRLSASLLGVLTLAVALLAWRSYRSNYWIMTCSVLGLVLVMVAAVLGGFTVMTELSWWVVMFHLGIAEAVVACMAVVVVVAWREARRPQADRQASVKTDGFNVLVLATLAGAFVLILFGSYMVGYGAGSSCGTWPLCRGSLVPDGTSYAIHMGHRYLAAVVGVLIIATAVSAWSRRARRPELGWAGLALALLLGAQVMAGAGTVWSGFATEMKAVHLSLATLMWAALVFLVALVFSPQRLQIPTALTSARRVSEPEQVLP